MAVGDLLLTDNNRVLQTDGISLVLLSGGAATHGPRIILAATYLYDESGNVLTDEFGNPLSTGSGGWLELANGIDFVLLMTPDPPVQALYHIINVG